MIEAKGVVRTWGLRLWRGGRFGVLLVAYAAWMSWAGRGLERPARVRRLARLQREGSRRLCRAAGYRIEVVGDVVVPEDARVLVIANHIGVLDPFIVASVFPVAWVAKSEIATWPVFGWVARCVGILFAHREQRMRTGELVDGIRERMDDGVPVAVFPEGTTSNGHALLPFKTGGFAALTDGVAESAPAGLVVPAYFHAIEVDGRPATVESREWATWSSPEGMWANLHRMLPHRVSFRMRIGAPVPAAGHTRKSLADASQAAMQALFEAERVELAPHPAKRIV
ncbi:MAG: lysophospholipid acyltransferase family protein [Rhodothermales bacterium]